MAALLASSLPAAGAWSVGDLRAAITEKAKSIQLLVEKIKASVPATPGAGADHGADEARQAFEAITSDAAEDAAAAQDDPAGAGGPVDAAAADIDDSSAAAEPAKEGTEGEDAAPLIRLLSWSPRSYLWRGFMAPEEYEHLIKLGAEHLTQSDVVDSDTGTIVRSKERTSSGAFLPSRRMDPIVTTLEERIARWTHIPLKHGEPFHILRYNPTEEYTAHFDSFFDDVHVQNGGQRIATVILYLSDVEEGGETVFPDSPTTPPAEEAATFSDCAKKGLGVKPRKGDAILFFSLKPDGKTRDIASLHAGCPVVKGVKWIATKWMRVGHYRDWGDPQEQAEGAQAAGAQEAEDPEVEVDGEDEAEAGEEAEEAEGGAKDEL